MVKKIVTFIHFYNNHLLPGDRVKMIQEKKLKSIIHHAYKTAPFYKALMDQAGVSPDDIQKPADLVRVPTITKDDIQKNFDQCISCRYDVDRCFLKTTSGSSGKMLRVLWDDYNFLSRVMLYYRVYAMAGYTAFKKLLFFLPEIDDPGFSFGLFRQKGMTLDRSFEEIRRLLLDYKPDILSIYPSYAIDLAEYLDEEDIEKIGLEAISLNSEMVMVSDRSFIEEKYRCPAYEEYSSVELGPIAAMCNHKGMHIFSDNVILEILDSEGNPVPSGERGEVTLTGLNSYAMPFIRYRIGDFSRILEESCTCGSSFPLLGQIEGRKDDFFITSENRHIPAWMIYEVVERPLLKFGVKSMVLSDFYIVQREHNLADFYYVKGRDFTSEYLDDLTKKSRDLFGQSFTMRITELDEIDRVKTVKRKYIHSEIN